jgi:hypothetical protein
MSEIRWKVPGPFQGKPPWNPPEVRKSEVRAIRDRPRNLPEYSGRYEPAERSSRLVAPAVLERGAISALQEQGTDPNLPLQEQGTDPNLP